MFRKLVMVILASMLLVDLLNGQIPRKRKKILKAKEKELKKHIKDLDALTEEWQNSWVESKRLPKQNLTKVQADYWRKLAEYDVGDEDNTRKRSVPGFRRDIRILNRNKREGPLIPGPSNNRVEWRHMTASRKAEFIEAVNRMASFIPDPDDPETSVYDIFVRWHRRSSAPGAHRGASFLPWHREYLWRFYNALRLQGYQSDFPYFDSALDRPLPEPRHSAFWSANQHGLGTDTGELGAPFTTELTTLIQACSGNRVRRDASINPGLLYSRDKYDIIMAKECFDHLCKPTDNNMENFHNGVHSYIGGTMNAAPCSPSDPVFWLHHANVDCLWEQYRQEVQDPAKRTLEYPLVDVAQENADPGEMRWNSPMKPFVDLGLMNIHGLSNHYGNYYYKCQPRPSSIECRRHSDCTPNNVRPSMLWCDVEESHCVAKIRENGTCNTDWPHEQCFCPGGETARCNAGSSRCSCN